MSVEDELIGADKVEHGIEEHDPNATQDTSAIDAKENGHEDTLKPVEVNMSGLEMAEIDGTLAKIDNGQKDPRKTIRARRKRLRPKWRKAISFRNSQNDDLNNGTSAMKSSYCNGGLSLDGVTECDNCHAQANGSAGTTESINYFQPS
ncbi:hypothetical protein OS493_029618 [Desmophyllum pertusum]|uniref:Uncharacterized protein n=1 Tax=Desmophyllum pertusum TaxID=174260 RepID=A0A9W9ZXJ9_9CNID|nr:hypothetical protein OS493_029618 [Desmophyllum pertusum]